ncbi:HDIG domain-containing metalloprotein [Geotalea sp. SG265]|uniref:HD family phosphohydrolase n=1 Tax=Geotalea sp. SG265 TaxID=2922867 RepID=UPI001FAFC928|nr:HDIG domain-containing metalloprotein [Geotalea sp. SG265]
MPIESGNKDRETKGSLILLGEKCLASVLEKISDSRQEKRCRFILLFFTALFITFIIIPSYQFLAVKYKVGDIATSDIRATQDYFIEDRLLTEKKRSEAEAASPFVYNYNSAASLDLVRRLESTIAFIRRAVERDETAGDGFRQNVGHLLMQDVSGREVAALVRLVADQSLQMELGRISTALYQQKIVEDNKQFGDDRRHGLVVRDLETKRDIAAGDYSLYMDADEARTALLGKKLALSGSPGDVALLKGIVSRMVSPNLTFDREATEQLKHEARSATRPVLFQVKRGEMIVRVGERVTQEQATKLDSIFESRGIQRFFMGVGIFGLVLVLFYFPYRFALKNIRKFNPSTKDILLLTLMTIGNFIVLKIASVVSTAMGSLFPFIDTADYYYVFPFAASVIIVRIILNSEVALVYCAVCAPLLGIMFNSSLQVVIYALLSGIVGAHGVRQCKERSAIYVAGLKVSVVNIAMAVSFQFFSDSAFTVQTAYCVVFAGFGGIFNAVCVTGTIPLIEALFHYTTDIKLLELANLNSPVLRELMIRAPGTYHHSVVVGNLVEAGAEAINANPLLARVAAYYHDVGKISKPLYFIENVGGGENRHDKLSPNMSALILISHVKEGVELARESRLGQPLIDIIRQSHGTSLINFFYQKAKGLAATDLQAVDERDFRYPGPKPQTREAGLVLLADCVEAASRTLIDPTPARIQGMVQKIINNIFIDGQLDECELTLKNLHEIAKSFNGILAGIYHQRIDYPEPAYKEKASGGKKPIEDSDSESAKAPADRSEEVKKGGGEDLKRLGMS